VKRKIFSVMFALVLVLSFGLVTAVPAGAAVGDVISSTDVEGPYVAGVLQEFSITTTSDTGYTLVLFKFVVADAVLADIASFQFYYPPESPYLPDSWADVPLSEVNSNLEGYFGPDTGFPMSADYNATTKFRVNFNTPKAYPVTLSLVDLTTTPETVITSTPFSIAVAGCVNDTTGIIYGTIQAAIDAATAGDTINVAAGTYTEKVVIGKPLILLGEDKTTTTINGGGEVVDDVPEIVVTIAENNVTVSGFTITGSGDTPLTDCGMLLYNVSGCTIEDNIVSDNGGVGIGLQVSDNNTIKGNTLNNNYIAGIGLLGSSDNTIQSNSSTCTIGIDGDGWGIVLESVGEVPSTRNTIDDNTSSNNDVGIYLGLECDENRITDNIITGNVKEGICAWKSGGNTITGNTITVNNANGIQLMASQNNTVTQNTITDNDKGILIRSGHVEYDYPTPLMSTGNSINYNDIHGNTSYGIFYEDNTGTEDPPAPYPDDDDILIDATNNWWGDASGPSEVGPGTGDNVSTNVDYSPWWGANYVGDDHSSAWTWYTNDSIQAAIDAASPGDTISVAAGTYNEAQLSINKNLTIQGAGQDAVTITRSGGDNYFLNVSGAIDFTMKDLTINASGSKTTNFVAHISGLNNATFENVTVIGQGKDYTTGEGGVYDPVAMNVVGGLDLINVTSASLTNVTVSEVGRNGFSFTNVNTISLDGFTALNCGHTASTGWAGVALYAAEGGTILATFAGTSTITNTPMGIYVEDKEETTVNLTVPSGSVTFSGQTMAPIVRLGLGAVPGLGAAGDSAAIAEGLGLIARLTVPSLSVGASFFQTVNDALTAAVDPGHYDPHTLVPLTVIPFTVVYDLELDEFFVGPSMSIQGAIDAATAGDIINVAAGTYEESVTVDKALTLLGAKADVNPRDGAWTEDITTINAGAGFNGILVTASGVTINGFKVTGSGTVGQVIDSESGIYVFNDTTELTDIVIKYCWSDANYGSGITLRYVLNPTVEYCYSSNNGDEGANVAGIAGQELDGGSISNNECFSNTNYGIYLGCGGGTLGSGDSAKPTSGTVVSNNELHGNGKYGIQIIGLHGGIVGNITVEGNDIHDNGRNGMKLTNARDCIIEDNQFTSNGLGDLEDSDKYKYGVMLSAYSYGTPAEGNSFTDNTFSGNNLGGIYMYTPETSVGSLVGTVAHFNNFIEGSGKWGINNTSAYLVDATNNWWGDASGPYHATTNPSGTGDAVSDNVAFYPWWEAPEGTSTLPTVVSTVPSSGGTDVAIGADITATFSEAMNVDTISGSTFTLANGDSVAGKVTYDARTKTATFSPTGNLAYGTTYTATITPGAQDVVGNGLAKDYPWSFTTLTTPSAVTTSDATDITTTSATLNGDLGNLGTALSVAVSFEYGTTTSYGGTTAVQAKTEAGAFSADITGLLPGTTYHFRAVAVGDGTSYGNDGSFTTLTTPSAVTTSDATDITTTSATLNGNLSSLGTASSVAVSFEWGETTDYDNETAPETMTAHGAFSASLTGLVSGTTYHFRAVAVGDGTSYGADLTVEVITYQITDLEAVNPTQNSIDLTCTTPEAGANAFSYFDVRYSKVTITPDNWNEAIRATGEPTPVVGASQGMKVKGLDSEATYYFAVKLVDKEGLAGLLSNIASEATLAAPPSDDTSPGQITGLAASAGSPATTRIALSWTATGDDGNTGTATSYEIRRSASAITGDNWGSATIIYNNIVPRFVGGSESFVVSRLTPDTTYYFAIQAKDEAGNTSPTSNSPSVSTAANLPAVTGISPASGDNKKSRTLTIDGTNFVDGANVARLVSGDNTFDLINVTCASSTKLTADVATGAPTGTYKVKVIDDNGTLELSSATYEVTQAPIPLPAVTNLIPQMAASGSAVSGVQIFGENLTGATEVSFDGTAASNVVVISDTKITADVPGLSAGEYDVRVTTPAGTNEISGVKFVVSDPVAITEGTTGDTTTSGVVTLDTPVIPVQLTLTTDTSETATQATDTDAEIEVVIPPGTTVTDSEGNDYTGNINPPRVVKPDESVLTGLPEDAVVIEMGNPEETINFDHDFVATVTITASTEPDIYYYNKDTRAYELAGKTGTKDGVDYVPGGTKLGQENSTYTMGLLLDHMSVYIASVESLIPPAPAGGGGGGGAPPPAPPAGTTDVRGMVSDVGAFLEPVAAISEDGLCTLDIPAGTVGLTKDLEPLTEVNMVIMDDPPAPPEGASVIGLVYDFGPDGATFDPPITMTFSYEPADVPEGVAEEDMVIAWYDEAAGEWMECECTCDPETNCVTACVCHFTTFGAMFIPTPAAFSLSALEVSPAEVETGGTVTISALVENTGEKMGILRVTLKVNGTAEEVEHVALDAGASTRVSFTTSRDAAGSYAVDVNGLSDSFTVKEKPAPVPVPPTPAPPAGAVNWPLISGIIAGVVVVGLLIFFLVRRRAH